MPRRGLVSIIAMYAAAAAVGLMRERSGAIRCECRADCWCQRSAMRPLRWVFPLWHRQA